MENTCQEQKRTSSEKLLLMELKNSEDVRVMSNKKMSLHIGLSMPTISKSLKTLSDEGLIDVKFEFLGGRVLGRTITIL